MLKFLPILVVAEAAVETEDVAAAADLKVEAVAEIENVAAAVETEEAAAEAVVDSEEEAVAQEVLVTEIAVVLKEDVLMILALQEALVLIEVIVLIEVNVLHLVEAQVLIEIAVEEVTVHHLQEEKLEAVIEKNLLLKVEDQEVEINTIFNSYILKKSSISLSRIFFC